MRCLTMLLLGLICVAVGCQDRVIAVLGGVQVTAVGSPSQITLVDDTAKINVGEREYAVAVENGKLFINGKDYGLATQGDEIIITNDQITINGKAAKPVPAE